MGGGVLLLAGLAPIVSRAQSYTVTDLGSLGGTFYYTSGINNKGQVLGYAATNNIGQTTLFSVAGGIVSRTNLDTQYQSFPSGINDAGQVAGYSNFASSSSPHAALTTITNGVINRSDLGTLGGSDSMAFGINNAGQVVGSSYLSGNANYHATLFSASNGTVGRLDLGTLGDAQSSSNSEAYGINNAGQAAGFSTTNSGNASATLFNISNGTVTRTDLGTLGGSESHALGINDAGQVVGDSQIRYGGSHATLFSVSGGAVSRTDLGTLGGSASSATSINNAGQVVGSSSLLGSAANHGFLYTTTNGMKDINSLVAAGSGASDINLDAGANSLKLINDYGQIAASGTIGGQKHAILLNPTTPNSTKTATTTAPATQNSKPVAGMNYNQVPVLTNAQLGSNGTTISLRDGTATVNRDVTTTFEATTFTLAAPRASDVVNVTGTGGDTFVLQLSYNETLANTLLGGEANARLDWIDPASGTLKLAVAGNLGGTALFAGDRAYNPATDLRLGLYGVDTANNTVWAVINHNSDFLVGNVGVVPEPSTWALLLTAGVGGLGVAVRRRKVS